MTEAIDDSCPTRSLQTTLVSCLCTLAVSVVAWWDDPAYMEAANAQLKLRSFFDAVVSRLVCPFSPFYNGVMHVMQALFLRSILLQQRQQQQGDPSSGAGTNTNAAANSNWKNFRATFNEIGVISACPIVIPIPYDRDVPTSSGNELSWAEVEDLRPLVMTPGTGGEDPKAGTTSDDKVWRSRSYIRVQTDDSGLRIRLVLLNLGLVPRYSRLQYLRTRSEFQALVTFLQTLGFTMGLVARWGEGLGVSPLEFLVAYFAIAALLHLGSDLFACVSFRTTLLLSLSPDQFDCFLAEFDHFGDAQLSTRNNSLLQSTNFLAIILTAAYVLIFSTAAMSYYRILYWHLASTHTRLVFPLFISQQGCSLFAFSAVRLVRKKPFRRQHIAISAGIVQQFIRTYFPYSSMMIPAFLSTFATIGVSVAIPVVAVVGTVKDWQLFNEAARNGVAWTVAQWILPHISSGN